MKKILILFCALFALGACGHNDDETPAAEDTGVDFATVVIDEITLTDENSDPIGINDVKFKFNENQDAFDSLL